MSIMSTLAKPQVFISALALFSSNVATAQIPSSPQDLVVLCGPNFRSLVMSWKAPVSNGGSALTGYVIFKRNPFGSMASKVDSVASTVTTFSHTNDIYSTFSYYVVATNSSGRGLASNHVQNVVGMGDYACYSRPDEPLPITATPISVTQIDLSWTEPSNLGSYGSSQLRRYLVEYSEDSGSTWREIDLGNDSTSTTYSHMQLTEGRTYQYWVRAANDVNMYSYMFQDPNASPAHTAVTATPTSGGATPSAPRTPMANAVSGTTNIKVTWTAPEVNASSVTSYRVQWSVNDTTWTPGDTAKVSKSTLEYTHAVGANSTTRHYRIFATSGSGDSPASTTASATTASASTLGAPTLTSAMNDGAGTTTITLTWTAPTSGTPTDYRVEWSPDGSSWPTGNAANVGSAALTYQHDVGSHVTTRHFRVKAIDASNPNGGLASNILSATSAAAQGTSPNKVSKPSVFPNPSNPTMTWVLEWTALGSNEWGSGSVGHYIVSHSLTGNDTEWTDETTQHSIPNAMIDGRAGQRRAFRVRAVNDAGSGPWSDTVWARLEDTKPDAVRNFEVAVDLSADTTTWILTWDVPSDWGLNSSGGEYIIAHSNSENGTFTELSAQTSTIATVSDGSPGDTRYFRVLAVNDRTPKERGPWSDVESAQLYSPPAPVTGLTVVEDPNDATSWKLDWTAVTNWGVGSTSGEYIISESSDSSDGSWDDRGTRTTTNTATVSGQSGETRYFRVRAVNTRSHEGPASNANGATLPGNLTKPVKVTGLTAHPWGGIDTGGTMSVWTTWILQWRDIPTNGWNGSPGEYEISLSVDGIDWSDPTTTRAATKDTALIGNGEAGELKYFRIRAVNSADGEGEWSNVASARLTGWPSPPTGLRATASDTTTIDLSWNALPTDAAGASALQSYDLESAESGTGPWTAVTSVPANQTTYSHTGLAPKTTVYYRLFARNATLLSRRASNITRATTRAEAERPSAPLNVFARAQNSTTIDVTWTAPPDGGSPITDYKIEVSNDGRTGWTEIMESSTDTSTTYQHTGLTANTTRHYRVYAINAIGESPASSSSSATTSANAPGSPTALIATSSSATSINLSWTAPANSFVTGYKIEVSTNGEGNWSDLVENTGNASTTYQHQGLTANQTRYYRVSAINTGGTSSPSNIARATTLSGPGPPQFLTATTGGVGSTTNMLAWQAPTSNGGSPIIGYTVQVSTDGGTNWAVLAGTDSATTTHTHQVGQTNVTRHYRVLAKNANGDGPWSNIASATTGSDVGQKPSAPLNLTAVAGHQQTIAVSWQPPSSDGGSTLTGYKVEVSHDGGTSWTLLAVPNATTTTFTHNVGQSNVARSYRVFAGNVNGYGPASNTATATTAGELPGPPQNLTAISNGATQIDLTWTTPQNDGGVSVTGYQIMVMRPDAEWTTLVANTGTTSTGYSDTGLIAATSYMYQVHAINAVGIGAPSNIATATTDGQPPNAPQNLGGKAAGALQIDLTWVAPGYDGGSSITGYRIMWQESGEVWKTLSDNTGSGATAYSHTGLEPATSHSYRVHAINKFGSSPASNTVTVATDATVPGVPRDLEAEGNGPTRIDLDWRVPDTNGGSPITGYRIEYYDGEIWSTLKSNTETTATEYTHAVSPGSMYRYRVSAINKIGTGPPSIIVTAVTTGMPPTPPRNLVAEEQGTSQIDLTWEVPEKDNGGEITGYRIMKLTSEGWTVLEGNTGSVSTTYSHTGLAPGTRNTYQVYAINKWGQSTASNSAYARTEATVPDPPTDLVADANGPYEMVLNWSAPTNNGGAFINGYMIEYFDVVWTTLKENTRSANTTFTHPNLEPGTTYRYRVSAMNDVGYSEPSNHATGTTDPIPPDPPTDLMVKSAGSDHLIVEWRVPAYTGGTNITGYRIEAFESGEDGQFEIIEENTQSTATLYDHRGLEPASTWHYRVSAINRAGVGDPSPMASGTTDPVVPSPPTGLDADNDGTSVIDLQWHEPDYDGGALVNGYQIEVSDDAEATWMTLVDDTRSKATSYSHTGLMPASMRHYRVRAINRAGASEPSKVASATTDATVPDKPEGLRAVAASHTQIDLTWEMSGFNGGRKVTGYQIEYSEDGATWDYVDQNTESPETKYSHTGLTPATMYSYRVSAINEIGVGRATDPVSARTHATVPDAPTDLTAEAVSPTRIDLDWLPPEYDGGAVVTGYLVEASEDDGETWEALKGESTRSPQTDFLHVDLKPGSSWSYRVSAINEAGTGLPSDVASAFTDDPVERANRVNSAIFPKFAAAITDGITEVIADRVATVADGRADQLRITERRSSASRSFGNRIGTYASIQSTSMGMDSEDHAVKWDGTMLNIYSGLDVRLPHNLLAGVSGSRASGRWDFTDGSDGREVNGTYTARMNSFTPYLAWMPIERISMWASGTYGHGEVEIEDETAGSRSAGSTLLATSGGLVSRLLSNGSGAFSLRTEGSVSKVRVKETEQIAEYTTALRRFRTVLQWTQAHRFSDGHTVSLVANGGFRYDANESADNINGAEAGGGFKYQSPGTRLKVEGRGRMLIALGSDYSEWGISGLIQVDPGTKGLAVRVAPSYGRSPDGIRSLWDNGVRHRVDPGQSMDRIAIVTEFEIRHPNIPSMLLPSAHVEPLRERFMIQTKSEFMKMVDLLVEGGYLQRGPMIGVSGRVKW